MTKIVAQNILKCITWALFSYIMCPYHQCLSKLMGEQHYKRVSEKFMFIYNFLRGFFTMKVVENRPQNALNCTILKNFLGGACPQTPLRGMYIKNPRNFKVGPPPPEKSCIRPCTVSVDIITINIIKRQSILDNTLINIHNLEISIVVNF